MQIRTRWMFVFALALTALGAIPAAAQSELGWVEGRWRWEDNPTGCDSAYVIHVSRDGKYVVSSWFYEGKRDTSEYRVLGYAPGVIRGQITGEKRKDADGNPVIWDFVRLSNDAFCWHRADWDDNGCTRALVRCTGSVGGRDAWVRTVEDPLAERRRRPSGG